MQVVVRGRVTVYEERGELQISAESIEPKGAGSLQIAFEQLKAKLEAEGLFAARRKKALPALPARVGIVTSPQAAALRDILNICAATSHRECGDLSGAGAGRRGGAGSGGGSAALPSREKVEVIVVARGGGSAEDLAGFNDEAWPGRWRIRRFQ